MTFPKRMANAGLVVFVTAGATMAVLILPSSASFELGVARVMYDLAAVAILAPWFVVAAIRPAWRPASRLAPAIAICLVAFAISTATSRFPRLSLEMLGYAVLLAELYLFLVATMRRPALRRHFERLALTLCLVVCVLYLLESLSAWQQWWSLIGHIALPPLRPGSGGLRYGSPNPVATVALMLGAFGLAFVVREGRAGRVLAFAIAVLIGAAVLVTASRGAWLGAAAGVVAGALAAFMTLEPLRRELERLRRSRRGVALIAVVIVLVGIAGAVAALSGRLTTEGASYRTAFAAASLKMFGSSPLVGVGPGTWQVLRAAYTVNTDIDYYVPHAHNIFLMTLAEFGLLGVLAGLAVAANVGLLVVRALRSRDLTRQLVGLAAVFVIVLFAAQQLVDVLVNVPGIMVGAVLPIAWLDATDLNDRSTVARSNAWARPRSTLVRWLPVGPAVITVIVFGGLMRIESVAATGEASVAAAESGDWHTAETLAARAASNDPGVNIYWYDLGVAAANAGDLREADAALTRSATTDDLTFAWLDLAAVRWKLGDVAGARQALDRAERLGWQRASIALAAGWLRQQLGDTAVATADYGSALAAAPLLAADSYWSSTVALRTMWPAIVQAASLRVTGDAALQLDLSADRVDAAGAVATQLATTDPGLYRLVIPAWNGDPAALAELESLAESRPSDVAPAAWCQLIAMRHSDTTVAHRVGSWLDIVGGAPSVPHITFGSAQPVRTDSVDRYGSLYRRPVPQELVVSILPQLTWQDHP